MSSAPLQNRADNARACIQQGSALAHQGLADDAATLFRQALQWQPDCADAHFCLGVVHQQQERYDEAAECYQQALTIDPQRSDALNNLANLGNVWCERGQPSAAIACYEAVLRFRPNYAEVHHNLGLALTQQGRIDAAVDRYRQAIAFRPDYVEAITNLGIALASQGHFDDAIACQRHALAIRPDYTQAYHNLGTHLAEQGRFDDAIACYHQAIQISPGFPDTRFSLAHLLLMRGDFQQGWQQYEWRWKRAGFPIQTRWDGTPQPDRTILLYAEQGLGDTIQFLRYAPLVRRYFRKVIVECQNALLSLVATCKGVDQVAPEGMPLSLVDLHFPLPSLPGMFGTTLSSIPADIPYLTAEPARVESWRRELSREERFKVGLVWQGNRDFKRDLQRSVKLAQYAPLTEVPGVALFSLQVGAGSEQLAGTGLPITDLSSRFDPKSLADLAAVLVNLDLLISVDTAPAHLAGALGTPVWIAVPQPPDWRWLLDRSDSPWYPTARLFRQPQAGNWDAVSRNMAETLNDMMRVGKRTA